MIGGSVIEHSLERDTRIFGRFEHETSDGR